MKPGRGWAVRKGIPIFEKGTKDPVGMTPDQMIYGDPAICDGCGQEMIVFFSNSENRNGFCPWSQSLSFGEIMSKRTAAFANIPGVLPPPSVSGGDPGGEP